MRRAGLSAKAFATTLCVSILLPAIGAGATDPAKDPPKDLSMVWVQGWNSVWNLPFSLPLFLPFRLGGGGGGGGGGGHGGGGGGATQTSASKAATADKHKSKAPPCLRVGDPIDPATGNKVVVQTDFALPGEMGLKFERYYMSRGIHGIPGGAPGWTDNLDFELHSVCLDTGDASCTTATFMRLDGSQLAFKQSTAAATGGFLMGPFTEVGGGGLATLTYAAGTDSYTVTDEDGMQYTWTANRALGAFPSNKGILASIKDASGIGWGITHPDSATTRVTHTSGQYMTLTTTPNAKGVGIGSLAVTDPAGNRYVYQGSTSVTFSWDLIPVRLASVSFPGANPVTVQYKYAVVNPDPGYQFDQALTEVDYNGVAHDLTSYDSKGNAVATSMADGTQKTSLAYGGNDTGATVTITNPLGHVSVYQYNAANLPIAVTGQATSRCGATLSQMNYDANGNMQSEVDNNGNTTTYAYAATGQLLQTVEAAGTPLARTTNYVWDTKPGSDRLLSVTVVGWSRTSWTYNDQNRLAAESVTNLSPDGTPGQTLTTTYRYTTYSNGMVQSVAVTRPSVNGSDVETYQYDALGNLASASDGLGYRTTYSQYNALGEPGRIVGPNGDTMDFTYDGRGLLLSKVADPAGAAATWTYSYDQFDLPSRAAAPDGEVTTWSRNAAGMLLSMAHTDKDGTSTETFAHDANGDVTADTVLRDGVVATSRLTSYDELGRPYLRQGMHGQSWQFAYDGNGNVLSVTDAADHVTRYTYDALNRVAQKMESGGASQAVPSASPTLAVPASSGTGAYVVSWNSVAGASSYTLQEQANGGGWVVAQSGAATQWSTQDRANGTYAYRAQACNASGCGPWGAVVTVAVATVPQGSPAITAPTSNASGTYTVAWSSVPDTTSYTLQEQAGAGGWISIYTGTAGSWNVSGHPAGSYGYRAQACNAQGCGAWGAAATVVVSIPAGVDGHAYSTLTTVPRGGAAAGHIGIRIANGTSWQVFNAGITFRGGVIASGTIPAAAVTVRYTWTSAGVPAGYADGQGSVFNGASTPVAVSDNPTSGYTSASSSSMTVMAGRSYRVRMDFYDATGTAISTSTCTLTATLEGSP